MRFDTVLAFGGLATAMQAPPQPGHPLLYQTHDMIANTVSEYLPSPNKHDPIAAEATRNGPTKMSTLTYSNWRDILWEPVKEDATTPEEWLLLVTGRNKTCYGRCEQTEEAWNEAAVILSQRENSPHLAILNCDDQPILCNTWSAGTGIMWMIDMLPPPANITIHVKRLNLTTTTTEDIINIYDADKADLHVHSGAFHPFNGWLTETGLQMLVGYAIWALNAVPSWAFMLFMSFVSRGMMNRAGGPNPPARAGAPAAGAPAAAAN